MEERREAADAGEKAAPPLADLERCCPRCGRTLAARSCKLVCDRCGYYVSCSDF